MFHQAVMKPKPKISGFIDRLYLVASIPSPNVDVPGTTAGAIHAVGGTHYLVMRPTPVIHLLLSGL